MFKSYLLALVAAAILATPLAASAADAVTLDKQVGLRQSFEQNTILDGIRRQHPCTSPDGSTYCTMVGTGGTIVVDPNGHARTLGVRQVQYVENARHCRRTSLQQALPNATCNKGDKPFANDSAFGL